MTTKKDLDKSTLYEAVKTLVEHPGDHLHLDQQKLFTLFSIAFQYILFRASKKPGHYILRIEDSSLAEKLAKKSKDETTRRFLSKLLIPRRLSYNNSVFHLDYFPITSWSVTKDLPKEKIQGAIIVKNTSHNPLIEETDFRTLLADSGAQNLFGEDFYLTSLLEFCPKTITIAYNEKFNQLESVKFPFIEEKEDKVLEGVRIIDPIIFEEE